MFSADSQAIITGVIQTLAARLFIWHNSPNALNWRRAVDSDPFSSEPNTDSTLPFEVIETAGGRLYVLPQRKLGAVRFAAIVPLAMVIGVCYLFVDYYLWYTAKGPMDDVTLTVFVLLSLVWLGASYILLTVAAITWCGHTEIEVTASGQVRAIDRAGIFRWLWVRMQPGIARQLKISEMTVTNSAGKEVRDSGSMWFLSVISQHGLSVWLAPSYPREVLTPLADILARQLALHTPPATVSDAPASTDAMPAADTSSVPTAPVTQLPIIVEEAGIPNRDILFQPPDSRVVVEKHPDGVTLTVPALGIWRFGAGLIVLGLIFAVVGAIVTVGALRPMFQPNAKAPSGAIYGGGVFFCIGVGMIAITIHVGSKKCVLAVVGDQLLTFETGPLGSRQREFTRDELLDIDCGRSNITVNKRPLMQLQIRMHGRRPLVGMLTGRDEIELKWIATVLRQALGISSVPPEYRKPTPDASLDS